MSSNSLYISILLFVSLLSSCGRANKKTADISPAGEYNEILYRYENLYRPDSLLEKVARRAFSVVGGIEIPDEVVEYVYSHTLKGGKPVRMERCRLEAGGSRSNPEITVYLPGGYKTFTLDGSDTVQYEQIRRDGRGRIVYEKEYSRGLSIAEFDFDAPGRFSERHYTYDTLNRLAASHWLNIYDTDTINQKRTTTYKGRSEEIVSERWESLSHPEHSHTIVYRTEQRGDTLVQHGYRDGRLEITHKTMPGYRAEISYNEDGSVALVDTKIDQNGSHIEVLHDSRSTDSLYYVGDLLMREVRISPEIHKALEYEYDDRNNKTAERWKVTFYKVDI